jgi:regulator of sigma E protease
LQTLDGAQHKRWSSLVAALEVHPAAVHTLGFLRDGEPLTGQFALRESRLADDSGRSRVAYSFMARHWAPEALDVVVPNPHPVLYAFKRGIEETARAMEFIVVGFVRIAQGRVSLATVSGPIAMYELAGQAGSRGASDFLWAVAIVSVNLGLVNLLPIPVLDGGHLALLAVEVASRRKVPRRVREVLSVFGVALLVVLMIVAFQNDLARRWDDYVVQVKDLVGS